MSGTIPTAGDGLEEKIADMEAEGWELKQRDGDRAIMIRRKTGTLVSHIVLLIVTGWWTFGLGNVLYLGYKYFVGVDKQVIRPDS